MSLSVDIGLKQHSQKTDLSLSAKTTIDLEIKPISSLITLDIANFPSFRNSTPRGNIGFVSDSIGLNIISQRLVTDADPLIISDINLLTLNDLDINQNITIYSI